MPRGLKTALTLLTLVAIIAGGGLWGWGAFTKPLPTRSGPPPCTNATVRAGESLTPEKVMVSVYNASDRLGLASRTATDLGGKGFVIDTYGDAPTGTSVTVAEVWVDDPQGPAGLLVRSYLGKRAKIRQQEPLGPGITVVVGPKFKQLFDGKKSIQLTEDTTICVPPAQDS
jgi:hypothetical protein